MGSLNKLLITWLTYLFIIFNLFFCVFVFLLITWLLEFWGSYKGLIRVSSIVKEIVEEKDMKKENK